MLQRKDTVWLNVYKNKIHIFAVYKKPTSELKTHIYWKWKINNQYYCTRQGSPSILNWWRNQKLFRQVKVNRIQYHQTSFTTNVKQTYIVKKYNRRKKIYKINPRRLENGYRNIYINNYFKSKWIKCSNQKTQTGWVGTITRSIFMLSTRNPLQT